MTKAQEKQDLYLNRLLVNGIVDSRKQAVIASARQMPNGEFGFCLLCLKDNYLNIYDTDFNQNVGPLLYTVNLREVSNFKSSAFIFNSYIKFSYKGYKYKAVNFGGGKAFLEAVQTELQ